MTLRPFVLCVSACGLMWAAMPTAQEAASALPVLRSVQAAEIEAAAYPRGLSSDVQPGFAAATNLTGTSARTCVDVGDGSAVQSGDFVAGPMNMFETSWQEGHTKVWWEPRYLADARSRDLGGDGLVVRETRLDVAGPTAVYRYGRLVRNTSAFFNSDVWLPTSGKWMLVATYKSNWGCFIVDAR